MPDQHPPTPRVITHVELPIDLVNRVLAYLAPMPFNQVADLILPLKATADASFNAQQATPPRTFPTIITNPNEEGRPE